MSEFSGHCLLVRCGDPEPSVAQTHGCFARWFREAVPSSISFEVVDARTAPLDPSVLDRVGAVIISGSPHAAYEPHPWIPALERFTREIVRERRTPLLGVCFGHQLLARALGGTVVRNPRGREMGTIAVSLRPNASLEPIFEGLSGTFQAQATHCDTVIAPPTEARVLATSSKDDCQSFAIGERAWGVQFHPEITAPIMRGYVRARSKMLSDEGHCPESIYNGVRDRVEGDRVLSNFIAMAFGD